MGAGEGQPLAEPLRRARARGRRGGAEWVGTAAPGVLMFYVFCFALSLFSIEHELFVVLCFFSIEGELFVGF